MSSKIRISIGIAILMSLVLALPAFAGGWAVITLDELPTNVVAGEPINIGFTVLQHGRTPMLDLSPTITAKSSNADSMVVNAEAEGDPGHYAATLTFSKAGNWSWSINAFTMDQPMPALTVSAPVAAAVSQPEVATKNASPSPLFIVRGLALVIGLVGLVLAFQRKSRQAVALTAFCLLIGLASFVTGSAIPANVEAQSKSSVDMQGNSSSSQVELGRQLFLAKGCITCHVNSKASTSSDYWTIDMGAPNLSKFSGSAEVLRLRLEDPAQVKSDTKMPKLHLADDEIEALIAFINSK
jgi:hypothetical protein